MSIAAMRYRYLDDETNVSVKDFTGLNDNSIYNAEDTSSTSTIEANSTNDSALSMMSDSVSELSNMVGSASASTMTTLKSALDSALNTISKLKLPDVVSNIIDSLKSMDLGGVKDFLKDLFHIGSAFLCNNLDFLKLAMLGYAINKNVLAGLMLGLLGSWLDRYCKGFTQSEMANSSKKETIEKMFPFAGKQITPNNAFNTFSKTYSDYLKSQAVGTPTTALSRPDFLSGVLSGNVTGSVNNLKDSEVSYVDKLSYESDLDTQLMSCTPDSTEYMNILSAKGEMSKLPLVSDERRDRNLRYSNITDQLGAMAKNMQNVDLSSVDNAFGLSTLQKGLYDKINLFKANSANSSEINTRDTMSGSFDNYDFSQVLPTTSPEEVTYMNDTSEDEEDSAHRYNDIHPSSEIFLEY